MKQTIIISSEELRNRAATVLAALPLEPVHELVFREHKKDRSASQHSLYWLWTTVIANELGETKEEIHLRNKKMFLVPIFERDDPDGYGQMIAAVRLVHQLELKTAAKTLAAQILKLTSTTNCNVLQFTELLNDIEKHYITLGITLPHPEDRWHEAMGR